MYTNKISTPILSKTQNLYTNNFFENGYYGVFDLDKIIPLLKNSNANKRKKQEKTFLIDNTNALIQIKSIIESSKAKEKAYLNLKEIEELEDNWNENGACKFNKKLIDKCYKILSEITYTPAIFPTACNSIQFEFDNENNNSYLELEIFMDHIKIYIEEKNKDMEFCIENKVKYLKKIKQVVKDFYE